MPKEQLKPDRFLDRTDAALITGILLVRLLASAWLLRSGFTVVSGDDFLRALIGQQWADSPFLLMRHTGAAAAMWMPMHFWLLGAATRITGELWASAIALSLIFTLISLGLLYMLAKSLGGRFSAVAASALAVLLPWDLWLGISAMPSSLFHAAILGGMLAMVSYEEGGRRAAGRVAIAASCFLASTMLRPEGWLFTVPFSGYVLWLALIHVAQRRWLLVSAALPWTFIASWFVFNQSLYGDPLHFLKLSREYFQFETAGVDSAWARLLQMPLLLLLLSPVAILLGAGGLFALCRGRTSAPWRCFLLLALSGFGMLVLATVAGMGTNTAPQRMVVPIVLLACIPAGFWLTHLSSSRRYGCAAAALLLTSCMALDWLRATNFNIQFAEDFRTGQLLRDLIDRGEIPAEQLICTEHELLLAAGRAPSSQNEQIDRACVDWALRAGSNHPRRFTTTLEDQFRRDPARRAERITEGIAAGKVGLILLSTPEGRAHLPAGFTLAGIVGKWQLYRPSAAASSQLHLAPPQLIQWVDAQSRISPSLVLRRFGVQKTPFPRMLFLEWDALTPPRDNWQVKLSYRNAVSGETVAKKLIKPFLGDLPATEWEPGRLLIQTILLPRDLKVPPGVYRLRIELAHASGLSDQLRYYDSPPLIIVESKRGALKAAASGQLKDVGLLARVLFSL